VTAITSSAQGCHADARRREQDRLVAGFAALAIAIHILEASFPSPLPGIKPGLANVVTLVVFIRHGFAIAAWVSGMRVLVGSLLIGTFMSPTFALSVSGAVSALLVMGIAGRLGGRHIGPVGLSVLSAIAHMSTQIVIAYLLFIPNQALFKLAPILLTAAFVFGTVSGIIASIVLARLSDQIHSDSQGHENELAT
jgi:heptaprenyl diphosphate synthase